MAKNPHQLYLLEPFQVLQAKIRGPPQHRLEVLHPIEKFFQNVRFEKSEKNLSLFDLKNVQR